MGAVLAEGIKRGEKEQRGSGDIYPMALSSWRGWRLGKQWRGFRAVGGKVEGGIEGDVLFRAYELGSSLVAKRVCWGWARGGGAGQGETWILWVEAKEEVRGRRGDGSSYLSALLRICLRGPTC